MIYKRSSSLIFSLLLTLGIFHPLYSWAATPTPSTTTLTLSSSTVDKNAAVTLTAAVNSGGKTVSPGLVLFCDATAKYCEDNAILGTAQLTAAGTASIKLTLGIGTHSIKAVFAGTNTISGSGSAEQSLTVTGRHPSTTTVSTSGSAGNYTLSANVVGIADQNVGPTGNVSFQDAMNNHVLASAALGASTPTLGFGTELATSSPVKDPTAYVTGDFNNDGKQDIALLNYPDGTLTVLLGKGDGTFRAPQTYTTTPATNSIAVGDFNSDGKLDLAVANQPYTNSQGVLVPGNVGVFLGNGDGSFQNQVTYPAIGPISVAVGDINRDGIPDLVIGTADFSSNLVVSGIGIMLGNGDGSFQSQQNVYTTTLSFVSDVVSDFNGDGNLDIAVVTEPPVSPPGNTLTVLLGNGDGTFQSPVNSTGIGNVHLLAADLNGDGKADLAVFEPGAAALGVLLGNGNGTFQNEVIYNATYGVSGLYLGDFNGDGILDMLTKVLSNDPFQTNNLVGVFLGKGDGTFQNVANVPDDSLLHKNLYGTGDFNGDGYPDLILQNNNIGVSLNESGQTATATATHVNGGGSQYVYAHYSGDSDFFDSYSCQIGLNTQQAAPVISGITASNITRTSATISWTTNVATYGGVNYGTTPSLGTETPWVVPISTAHSFTLTHLTPGTTYYYAPWAVSYFSGCTHWTTFSNSSSFTTAN